MKKRSKRQKNLCLRPSAVTKEQRPGLRKTKPDEKELLSALAPLSSSLDAFGEETEKILAGLATPDTAYFAGIARKTPVAAKKTALMEAPAFIAVAIAFLTGILWVLQAGYFVPVAFFYGIVALFLPTVILFVPEARQEEVNE